MGLHVIVIGGGIGGLCLAQGLRKAGVRFVVYEKGPRRADPHWLQGYQIHINPAGSKALQECLKPEIRDALVANACKPSSGFQVLTEQLKRLCFVEPEMMDGSSHIPIVRVTLRQVLLEGLGDVIHFGKQFVRYERKQDGKVEAFFEDGASAIGDVLVGADGTHSKVRAQYLPRAEVVDTGVVGAAGRVPINEANRYLPEHLLTRLTIILPLTGASMIVTQSIHKPGRPHRTGNRSDHVIWVLVSSHRAYGNANPHLMEDEAVKWLVRQMIEHWHPVLRRMVADTDPMQVSAVPVLTSVPIEPWEWTNITLLGDAIHTMTPLQGLRGSSALRDAGLLCRKLVEVDRGSSMLLAATHEYEAAMVEHGFNAVRISARFADFAILERRLP